MKLAIDVLGMEGQILHRRPRRARSRCPATAARRSTTELPGRRPAVVVLLHPLRDDLGRHRQIQRNIVGERVLGLPKEPKAARLSRSAGRRARSHGRGVTRVPGPAPDYPDRAMSDVPPTSDRERRGAPSGAARVPPRQASSAAADGPCTGVASSWSWRSCAVVAVVRATAGTATTRSAARDLTLAESVGEVAELPDRRVRHPGRVDADDPNYEAFGPTRAPGPALRHDHDHPGRPEADRPSTCCRSPATSGCRSPHGRVPADQHRLQLEDRRTAPSG